MARDRVIKPPIMCHQILAKCHQFLLNYLTTLGTRTTGRPLVAELVKLIPQIPTKSPTKEDKLADRVARHNPKVFDGTYDQVALEESIGGIEKIFTMVEVPDEKKVNIRTYYLTGDADMWWKILLRISS